MNILDKLFGETQIVYAHCDIPCGIYNPHQAQIGALTIIRMVDLIDELKNSHKTTDSEFAYSMSRYAAVKEEHTEMCKHEIRIIWGDYFKSEIKEKYTELDGLVHKIMQLGSKARQETDRVVAIELLQAVNRFAEIFWETKGIKTKKVKAPYKPEEEIIYPILE